MATTKRKTTTRSSKPKVFVTRTIPSVGLDLLRNYCTVKVWKGNGVISRKELDKGAAWADCLVTLLTETLDAAFFETHSHLKIVANYAVGYDNIDLAAASAHGVVISNTPGVLSGAVSEHTLALLFSLARHIVPADKFARSGNYKQWEPLLFLGPQLHDKTLGIVGTGRIGTNVALKAHALGMKIVYYDVTKNARIEKATKARKLSLAKLLSTSDFVSIHVPLLPSTRHLLGAKEFARMKKTALLVNTSRGPVLDEVALERALRRQEIAGAALDVFEFEPKITAGLKRSERVIITPHIASATHEARDVMALIAAQNVLDVILGKKARTVVNKEVYARKRRA